MRQVTLTLNAIKFILGIEKECMRIEELEQVVSEKLNDQIDAIAKLSTDHQTQLNIELAKLEVYEEIYKSIIAR